MQRTMSLVFLLIFATAISAAPAGPPSTSAVDSTEFARLKTLAGTWLLTDDAGKPTTNVGSVFEVVAMGHSIRETMFPGTPEEMVNMYYRNGPATEMVHYCASGNQPRLRISASGPAVLTLNFIDATNLSSPDAEHMRSATYSLEGNDRLRTEWQSWKDGKPSGTTVFRLVRQPAT
ncbi:MAG: hypothetical protein ABIX37_02900 [Gammaproteobacteria bacterium]